MESAGGAGYRLDAGLETGAGFQSNSSLVFMLSTTMITVINYYIFAF